MNLEEYYDNEPFILANHSLDTTNIEVLANDIANRLGINISYKIQDHSSENDNNSDGLRKIEKDKNKPYYILFSQSNEYKNTIEYYLELGDETRIITKEIIELQVPFVLQFDDLLQDVENNTIREVGYMGSILTDFKKLGADEVYFVIRKNEHLDAMQIGKFNQLTWSELMQEVKEKTKYFTIPVSNQIA